MKTQSPFIVLSLIVFYCLRSSAQTNTEIQYLSGTDKDNTVAWQFMCSEGRNSQKWTTIPVPSCWETYDFGNTTYGFRYKEAPEKGFYKYTFKVPSSWKNKQINIVFEGSMTDTEVKINGKLAGEVHQGAFYRFKYNITNLLKIGGDNLLEVTVSKISTNNSVNRAEREADYWVFGGIYRPVYLEALPIEHIDRIAINATADGVFSADLYTSSLKNAVKTTTQILTLADEKVAEFSSAIGNVANTKENRITTKLNNVRTWNPENPFLYKAVISLEDKNGKILHTITEKFGFRTVELRKRDGIYVNGVKIMFKGVNRHSFHPVAGRTTSKAISIEDVTLIKEMNMNAVRMSHYPPDKHFLEVCDSLGLFVLNELAGWQKAYDTIVGRKLVKELVVRDVNHPSVVIWDNGNEGGFNFALDEEYAKYDPQNRPVIHPWAIWGGADNQHYKQFDCCVNTHFNGKEVFFPTEFQHGLYDGGHGAGLDDFWNAMLANPLSAGGFLWVFADEGFVRADQNNTIDLSGNQAPDGIVGPYKEKEASFYTIKEIWSPIHFKEKYLPPTFDGKLTFENRYYYTNAAECSYEWKLVKFALPHQTTQYTVIQSGKGNFPNVNPQEKGTLMLELKEQVKQADALLITAKDNKNNELYTWSWTIKSPQQVSEEIVKTTTTASTELTQSSEKIIVKTTTGLTVEFNRNSGLLESVTQNGKKADLSNGPVMVIGKQAVKQINTHSVENTQFVEIIYHDTSHLKKLTWEIKPNGWIGLAYQYQIDDYEWEKMGADGVPYIGVSFDLPEENVIAMRWLGKGPYRVWKNRLKGVTHNVWTKKANNTRTGCEFDYPEFRGFHAELYWAKIETTQLPIYIVSETENLFLRLLTPANCTDPRGTQVDFPKGDISFLHAISPIGNKFMSAKHMGLSGQNNILGGPGYKLTYQAKVWFFFGEENNTEKK
jgi:hypothetical protein